MKATLLTFIMVLASVALFAQSNPPRVDAREGAQRARIHEGRQDGEVTRREARALNREQRNIHRTEKRAKADGKVGPREKRRLEREQDRANRHIRRAKHNGREQKQ